jgi:hypothetical protein
MQICINSSCGIRHGPNGSKVLKEAAPGLGLKADRHRNIQAGAEGVFFLHQDSEKADEIFGTDPQYTGAELSSLD